jgi:putative SOS response-associated peptidase YedK
MPVILPRSAERQWLKPDAPPDALAALLVPHTADTMRAYAVSARVNTPRNDDPSLIEPAAAVDAVLPLNLDLFP